MDRDKVFKFIDKWWFIFGIIIAVLFAFAAPQIGKKGGWIHSEITIKYIAVSIIFLLSGLSLKTKELKSAILFWRIHLAIQTFNLIFIPIFIFVVTLVLMEIGLDHRIGQGLIILGTLPTSISSCVVMTKSAQGNEAAALFNASFGNLLGLVVTPAWLFLFVGNSSTSSGTILWNLGTTVVLPICVGQVIQTLAPKHVETLKAKVNISKVSNVILLCIIWTTFCDTFSKDQNIAIGTVILTIFIVVVFHVTFLAIAFFASGITLGNFFFTGKDRIAILFCATQKTIALGIPLINIMYAGDSNIGFKSLPILIYHPSQLIIGAFLLGPVTAWGMKHQHVPLQEDAEMATSYAPLQNQEEQPTDPPTEGAGVNAD